MSLEEAIKENTAVLREVAALLTISNGDRKALIEKAGISASPAATSAASNDGELSVADIKEAVKTADLDTLKQMLEDEKGGKNRSSAVSAIENAIKANSAGDAGEEPSAGAAETASTEESQAASPSSAPAAEPKSGVPSADELKGMFGAWFGETDDEKKRLNRRGFVEQIVEKLGAKLGDLDEAGRAKAAFYLARVRAGVQVDFSADYDFAGDPAQTVASGGVDDLM